MENQNPSNIFKQFFSLFQMCFTIESAKEENCLNPPHKTEPAKVNTQKNTWLLILPNNDVT